MGTRFEQKYEKYQSFLCENFQFLEVKFSIYLYRRVFVMPTKRRNDEVLFYRAMSQIYFHQRLVCSNINTIFGHANCTIYKLIGLL